MGNLKTCIHGYWVAVKRLLLHSRRCFELRWPFGRPTLEYVETHLVDHCNLNCCGCSHFSPLAEPWFAKVEDFRRDMEALARLFRSVRTIRLMGGEPLLHPQVERFLACARGVFPKARIHLVTNGLLLTKMPDAFWTACRENRIVLAVTIYPPMTMRVSECIEMCRKERVSVRVTCADQFCLWLNRNGDSPVAETFAQCRKTLYCPILKGGALYACATAAYIGVFNRRFGPTLPLGCGLALNEEGLTGRNALEWLDRPVELCRYCAREKDVVAWKNGLSAENDWYCDHTVVARERVKGKSTKWRE